jgi:hypothetical protein
VQVKFGALPGVYKTGEKFSDVLAWNHYGTETIPPRPVLRIAAENYVSSSAFKIAMEAYKKNLKAYMKSGRVADMVKAEKELLRKMGVGTVVEAKRIIKSGGELQHNAPSTIAKKGEGKPPLYDTGELLKKISYEVSED